MSMSPNKPPAYTFAGAEKIVNSIISFIFYYRIAFVFLFLIGVFFFERRLWFSSDMADRLKNCSYGLTAASIIMAISYAILNYEYAQIKFKHDVKTSRDTLTFNTASKSYDVVWIDNFRILKTFYLENKDVLAEQKCKDFQEKLEKNIEAKKSFILVFNYLECVALGIEQGIIDEIFIQAFFKGIVMELSDLFGSYLNYLRRENKNQKIYVKFTTLASKWKSLP